MTKMQRAMRFLADESGPTAVEYSVMIGFILLVVIGAVALFGNGQNGKWLGIGSQMHSHGM